MKHMETAVVTGGNRGLGREVCRQLRDAEWRVVLTARDEQAAEITAQDLGIEHHQLDVTSSASVARCVGWLRESVKEVHALINNAGVHYDTGQRAARAEATVVEEALGVNLMGAWRTSVAMLPLMPRGAKIVNVSSGAGSFAETAGTPGTPAYAVSKAALNMLTVKLAADLIDAAVLVNAVCPGWVATDMGGAAGRPVSAGAAGIVWAATLPADGPTGGFTGTANPSPDDGSVVAIGQQRR